MRNKALWCVVLLATLLAGCAARERSKLLDETLKHYNALIRWSEYAAAADHYDPALRREKPITGLQMSRLAQFRVSGYDQRALNVTADGSRATQVAEIRLYNVHDLTERTIIDRQVWRYDPEAERWWLTTGLPNVTAGRSPGSSGGTPP